MNIGTLLVSILFACIVGQPHAQTRAPTLSFGIDPQKAASKLAEDWSPLLEEIGRRAGVNLVFHTAPSIPAFEERLSLGRYDLAYMNPYHYVVFHDTAGYRAFAKEEGRKIRGIIVVQQDSSYRKIDDLAGRTVAFPAPAAFAASILTQLELEHRGINITAKFVALHESVYRIVAAGRLEAGGGMSRTFEAIPPDLRAQLRVLAETPTYTPHAFAAHPRVTPAVITRVRAAMVSLAADESGRRLLNLLAMPMGFAAAENADWNDIRALDLRQLEKFSKQ